MIRDWLQRTLQWRAVAAALCCVWLLSATILRAETIIEIFPAMRMVDLSVHGAIVDAERRKISVEIPESRYAKKTVLDLEATGPGPRFTWTVYSFHNADGKRRDFVIAIDAQRLSASGFLPMRPFGPRALSVTTTGGKGALAPRASASKDIYDLVLEPGAAVSVAVEGATPMSGIRLYDEAAFSKRETSVAFLRGAALTVTLVITIFIVGLYSIRSHRAFVAGSFLALACLQFMGLESGYADRFGQGIFNFNFGLQQLRAWSESILALALSLSAWGLTSPNAREQRSLWWAPVFLLVFAGLCVLGWYLPSEATATARVLIAVAACAGFVIALRAKQAETGAMDLGMSLWSAIVLWVFFAAVAALGRYEAPVFHAGILSGLATVVALLAFALARFALAQGYQSNPYLREGASRSLALAGGRHVMWDWRAVDGRLHLGRELAETLGLDQATFNGPDAARMLLAHVHPADQITYQRCTAIHALNPGDAIEADVRLQAADGQYRWFALRATAIPGASNWPERAVGTLTDITSSKESEDRLITEALRDPVTGLPSRAIFNDRLDRELAKPLGLPVKVLLVGLSRFKALNEGLGHDLGDQMLLAAGERIAGCIGTDDTLARLSGSMFAVMHVEAIDKRNADDVARDIIGRLADPMPVAGQDIRLAACIGISAQSKPGVNAAELHDQASRALHEAQTRGLSIHLNFDESMTNDRAKAVTIESDLRHALSRGEIEVHYQPVLHLSTGIIVGFEALARWNHPERGYLPPNDFIAVAEQSGLVGEINASVMGEAARQLGIWQRTLARSQSLFVAVNVSSEQLTDTGLFDRIVGIVEREALKPDSLKIEITESIAMRFPERARQLISKLKASGVSVACDDFGTGFSNLASLRDLQFDTLKMDRSFIANGGIEDRGGVILSSVVSLAHQLGMQVVAEGVEDEQQALLLEAIGADMGQGYWLGEPKQARDVPGLLSVFPVIESLPALPLEQKVPEPGQAPMAPRRANGNEEVLLHDEELFADDVSDAGGMASDDSAAVVVAERKAKRKPKSKRPPKQRKKKTKAGRKSKAANQA